jgi:lambda family phage portal protein
MSIVDGGTRAGTITASIAPPKARASDSSTALDRARVVGVSPYHAGSMGTQELAGWHPSLRAPDAEVLPARDRVVARSRDLDRNNGWAQGGVTRRVDAVVGANIRLRARPDWQAMGMDEDAGPKWADEWARQVESLWRCWSRDPRMLCDVERHLQFGGLVRLAYQHYVIDGEAAAPIYFIDDRGGIMATSVLILDPDRLSNPNGRSDGKGLDGVEYRGGVELDPYGAAQAYWVRNAHPNDVGGGWDGYRWTRVPREGPTGRPLFVHAINKRRAHQHRSIGMLSSVMGRMKMLDRYDSVELQAAITNAVFGMYVTSPFDSDFVKEAMAPAGDGNEGFDLGTYQNMRMAYHEQADVSMNGVRLAHLFPNEKIETVAAERPTTNFAPFESAVLGSIASALGISKEQLSQDWTGINYSSARTLLNEIWRGLTADRHLFTQAFCTPIYSAWLEEAVARDLIQIPGGKSSFYVFRSALCQAEWIGPGRGWVDPYKEAQAAQLRMNIGITSQTDECAEQGRDADEVRWQRKRDKSENERYGLAPDAPLRFDAGGSGNAASAANGNGSPAGADSSGDHAQ